MWLIVLLCTFFIGWEAFYYEWGRVVFCAALVPLVLLFLCAFAAQCKAGTVLRGALIGRIARFLWRIVRSLFLGLWRIARNLPLLWKTALVMSGVFFLEMLFVLAGYGSVDGIFVIMKAVELLAALYIALNLRALQKGGEKLANGNLSSPIDTRYLIGDFKRYGQELNDVQSGLEQAVQEQMKAEHLKTELITNMFHDIKTPLTSIVNYVDTVEKGGHPLPKAREYIAVLDRQSHRLKKLTEDLVEASKASSGVLNVDLQPTDVNVLFSQIEGEYQERLAACQLTLVTQPPAPGTVIRADSRLLSRVMDNLVSNICKYALPSTRVYVVSTLSPGGRYHQLQERLAGRAEYLPRRADGAFCARRCLAAHGGQRTGAVHSTEPGAAAGRPLRPGHRRRPFPRGYHLPAVGERSKLSVLSDTE